MFPIVLTAACAVLSLALASRPASGRPRLDPRLRSVQLTLTEERAAGRTPRLLALSNAPVPPGVRVGEDASGKNLVIDCIMNLDPSGRAELLKHGITPRLEGRFTTVSLTPEQLDIVAELPGIVEVEMARELKPYLDLSGPLVHATEVHGGPGPNFSATGFTGRGVVIGIVDTGVDVNHDDFRKPNGLTRIKYFWDQQNGTGIRPPGFSVGSEWTAAQINSGQAFVNDANGHGSHVAGIAAGDGSATGNGQPANRYIGIAPEADLIVVKTTFQTTHVLEAIDYIFQRAGSQDAVINLSLGTQEGPHDGTSPFDRAIAERLGPGRIVVAAAGNESNSAMHARLSMSPGTDSLVFTTVVPAYTPSSGAQNDYFFLDGWYEGTDNFSFVIESPSGWRSREITNNNRLVSCTGRNEGRILVDNNNTVDVPAPSNGDRELYIEVTDYSAGTSGCGNPASGTWKIIAYRRGNVSGPGHIDIWMSFARLGGNEANYPRFVEGNSNSFLVGSPASAPGVLSVGAWISRRSWTTMSLGNQQYANISNADIGRIAPFSSPGPLREGTNAPDLVAPGMGVASVRSATASADDRFLLQDGRHIINQGTSQAAPHVAGAVALLLEKCPLLSPAELFERFTATADRDDFTGPDPGPAYGYGKLDILGALSHGSEDVACGITGPVEPETGSTLTYSDATPGARGREWSVVSVPEGIATIVGSRTGEHVQVHFSGNGSAQLVLGAAASTAEDECRTLCKLDLEIGAGFLTTLEAVSEPGQIRLHWRVADDAPQVNGFHVLRADDQDGPPPFENFERITTALLTGGPEFEFVDADVIPGQEYWYRIEAEMAAGGTQQFGPLLGSAIPVELRLAQNGPNPFASETRIDYSLPANGPARIDVYDLSGRKVRTLFQSDAAPLGQGQVTWDSRDDFGRNVPDGIYFYQLVAGSRKETKKMLLLRR